MANKEKLFTEFTAPTTQEWLRVPTFRNAWYGEQMKVLMCSPSIVGKTWRK